MKSSLLLIVIGLIFGIAVLIGLDRGLEWYLNRIGYFKALTPDITEAYKTEEFTITATMSSQGLRNGEVTVPKPKNVYRILALGDSFTFGWGINLEDSWLKLLEKKLHADGKKVEIVNAGIPGAGVHEETLICQAYKDYIGADALLIQLFTDDLYQALAEKNMTKLVSPLIKIWPTLARLRDPIVQYNVSLQPKKGETLDAAVYWKKLVDSMWKVDPSILSRLSLKAKELYLTAKINPSLVHSAHNFPQFLVFWLDAGQQEQTLGLLEEQLSVLKKKCSGNMPVLVVFMPSNELVSVTYQDAKKELGYEIDQRLLTANVDDMIGQKVKNVGWEYVSLLPEFRRDTCEDCYYLYDGHFTKVGNERAADLLAPKLQEWLGRQSK